jgi:hypothetical protein
MFTFSFCFQAFSLVESREEANKRSLQFMSVPTENKNKEIDTSHWYAIFSGWLIVPAIFTFLTFISSLIMVLVVRPSGLNGFDLMIYWMDVVFLLLLIVIYSTWLLRKKVMPIWIIAFFMLYAIWNVTYFVYGFGMDVINLAMCMVWIVYFVRSERVKAIFIH